MPKALSLNARQALYAENAAEIPVVLVAINHEDMEGGPVRLSSDPTERLSADPLTYGTRSNAHTYYFVRMSALLPDDMEGTPPSTSLVFENVDYDMVSVLRSVTSPADVTMQLVLASTPNVIEESYTGLKAVTGSYTADSVTLTIARETFTSQPWPSARMTKSRFPGLHR